MKITQQSSEQLHLRCASCGGSDFVKLFDAQDFDTGQETFSLYRCPSCSLVHTTPVPSEQQLGAYYKPQYYGKGNQKFSALIEKWTVYSNLKLARSIAGFLKDKTLETDRAPRVLDIGCGRGNLLKAFSRMGFECHGIERTEFPDQPLDSKINIHKDSLSEVKFEDSYFDIVILWHVLDHLTDPAEIINEIQRILNDSGTLVIAVPNFGSAQSRLFKQYWFHLDLPRHLYHFETESLNNLLNNRNFKSVSLSTKSIDQSVYGFIQSALNSLKWFEPNSFYEQLKLPLLKRKTHFFIQAILAAFLVPVALIDYLLSISFSKGSCLIVTAKKGHSS